MGDPNDYTFMRSGVANGDVGGDEALDAMTHTLMGLGVAMIGKSAETAAMYAQHAGRKSVTVRDVHIATKYQARVFMDEVTDEDVNEGKETVDSALRGDEDEDGEEGVEGEDDSSSESESEADEDADAEAAEEEEEEWTRSTCACKVCVAMNESEDTWDTYAPDDEVLVFLKRTVDRSIAATTT